MPVLKTIGRVLKSGLPMGNYVGSSRYGTGRYWFYGLLPGAKVDYERIAGDRWKNAIVQASLAWISRNLPQAPPCVYRENAKGEEKIVPGHPLTELLKRPNPYYDGRTLRQATFLSLIAGRGNAYWWIKRGPTGLPLELWYLPHFDCWPLWDAHSTTDNWIVGYAYRNNGTIVKLENDEVIHFRDGMDPENQRMGLDPLKSGSREMVTDNEASGFAAALLKNMGVPGVVISPAHPGTSFQTSDSDELKAMFEENAGGDNRGRPIVLSGGVRLDRLNLSPNELLLDHAQDRPEARLTALIGINPVVLGLTIGLEHATYANMEEAERGAWRNGIIPRLEMMNSELDTQLLPCDPNSGGLRVGADYRRVLALQDSLDNLYKRNTSAVGGPWLAPNEARQAAGLPPIAGGDGLYQPMQPEPGKQADGQDTTPAKEPAKKDADDAVTGTGWMRRRHLESAR